jgi:hypothetical protein
MSKTSHPYKKYEGDPIWRALEKAIKALVKNGDLEEKTARSHIVGYLTQSLRETGIAAANGSAKRRKVIQINRNEEVLVRGAVA